MMNFMRSVDLRSVDLNLLHPLRALLEERHVTRAAKRCFLSQPAMSRAFERLRADFADPLLVRTGRAYERTVRGERLLRELDSLMPRLEALVRGEGFEPANTRDRFRLAVTDHASAVLMPGLLRRIRLEATKAVIEVVGWHERAYDDVAAGRLDLALSAEAVPPALQVEVLYEEDFVCLVGSARPMRRKRFTLKEYLDRPHVIVETWGDQQTPVDRPLAELGLKRRAALRVPFFVPTLLGISGTDLTLTVPRRLVVAIPRRGLQVIEPPREIRNFSYFMVWHPRLDAEPAQVWFRDQVRSAARALG
jgi:DNA-binding transcriptional LysR family regulator